MFSTKTGISIQSSNWQP